MAAKIQEAVDRTPEGVYEAILLGYGLCGNGLDGLTARHTRLVLPRAHDCIALLMGSRERYQAYFEAQPRHLLPVHRLAGARPGLAAVDPQHHGVRRVAGSADPQIRRGQRALSLRRADALPSQYRKLTFIETGLEAGGKFVAEAAAEAKEKGWSFERLPGDLAWLRRLVEGEWAEAEFVVAEPGQRIVASYDTGVL